MTKVIIDLSSPEILDTVVKETVTRLGFAWSEIVFIHYENQQVEILFGPEA